MKYCNINFSFLGKIRNISKMSSAGIFTKSAKQVCLNQLLRTGRSHIVHSVCCKCLSLLRYDLPLPFAIFGFSDLLENDHYSLYVNFIDEDWTA